jgi:UDP-N-acetylmuramyl pentapeptide phosphotransferase/UDP-N-acetylglucosamine-1-phosphate transferase
MKKIYIAIIIALLIAGVAAFFFEPTRWLGAVLTAILISAGMAYFALRDVLVVSCRKNLYDLPDRRRIHLKPTSRLGGVIFGPIISCSVIFALSLVPSYVPAPRSAIWICSLVLLCMIGVMDDLTGIRYKVKFTAQVIAGLLVVYSGLWIDDLHGLFGLHALPPAVGMPLTVLLIVFIINAFNLIDGMDGLASGLVILTLGLYGVRSCMAGQLPFAVVSAASLGVLIPFFYANVRGLGSRHRKLFMGDTGSLTLGFLVGMLAVGQLADGGAATRRDLIWVLSPLVIPVFDVLHVVVFRLRGGHHPFHPDKTHIHHRMLRAGFGQHQALVVILLMAAVYPATNVLLAPHMNATIVLMLDVAIWCVLNGALSAAWRRHAAASVRIAEKRGLRGDFGRAGEKTLL